MNEIVIDVAQCGRVTGMHRDEFNLGFLGNQKIERASDIRFDEGTQQWRIWLADKQPGDTKMLEDTFTLVEGVGAFPTYNAARDFEVLWLNEAMKAGFPALSPAGVMLGVTLYQFNNTM